MRMYEVNVEKILEKFTMRIRVQEKYISLIKEVIQVLTKHDGKVLNRGIEKHLPENMSYYQNEYSHRIYQRPSSNKDYSLYFNKVKGEKVRINIKELNEKLQKEKVKLTNMLKSGENIVERVQVFNLSLQHFKKAESELMKIEGMYDYNDYN